MTTSSYESLSHSKWDCKYHLVFVSKYRLRRIYGEIRKKIGGIIRDLCQRKEIELHEGHAKLDHIHLLLSIPPKYSVSNTAGFIKLAVYPYHELLHKKLPSRLSFGHTVPPSAKKNCFDSISKTWPSL